MRKIDALCMTLTLNKAIKIFRNMSKSYTPQPLLPINPNLNTSENHYWNYHNIEALINCKNPLRASQDEDLFIAVQ